MTAYLRRAEDRKQAILKDLPDTKFEFESQKFSDIPKDKRPPANRFKQWHSEAAQEIKKYNPLIEEAAKRNTIDPDLVRAIIYTEISRGGYGYTAEAADRVLRSTFGIGKDVVSKTILPGNLDPSWQELIPNSDVHKPQDNIELTAKLIAAIAKRLDDPSVENIYALYNSLSHDRTYVNKEIKSTPYYARRAFEAKAWEKDKWSAPNVTDEPVDGGQPLPGKRGDRAGQPDTAVAQSVPAWLNDRFGHWPSGADNAETPQAPLLRELARRNSAEAVAGRAFLPDGSSSPVQFSAEQQPSSATGDGVVTAPDGIRGPIRILRSRRADEAAPALPWRPTAAMPDQLLAGDHAPSFDDRFGSWGSRDGVSAPLSPYQQDLPMPWSAGSVGGAGPGLQQYPFALPEVDDAKPGLEEWSGPWSRRSPWTSPR